MTNDEIKNLSAEIAKAFKKSGFVFTAELNVDRDDIKDAFSEAMKDALKSAGRGGFDDKERAARRIVVKTVTSTRNLGKAADSAGAALRLLTKSSALAAIGLTHFAEQLDEARGRVKPTEQAARRDLAKELLGLRDAAKNLNNGIKPTPTPKPPKPPAPTPDSPTPPRDEDGQPQPIVIPEPKWIRRIDYISDAVKAYSSTVASSMKNRITPDSRLDKVLTKLGAWSGNFMKFMQFDRVHREKNAELMAQMSNRISSAIRYSGAEALNQMFDTLAARGYAMSNIFGGIGMDAIHAGMSLQDYTQLLDESMAVVVRSTSFADFNKKLQGSVKELESFGIFTGDATKAAATLATASTNLGVPQDQLSDAITKQTKLFGKMQHAAGMTVDQFAALARQLGENNGVQAELLGLAPKERASRQQQLLEQTLYAKSIGLSEQQVSAYTQAILEMRRSTVKQRFNQAGRLMQAASVVGMGGSQIEELRQLAMNRYKSDEQNQRYMQLLAQVNAGMERMQLSGGTSAQFIADTLQENLSSNGLQGVIDAASSIQLTKDSGAAQSNRDMGVKVGEIAGIVGKILKELSGWTQNPVASLATTVSTTLVTGFLQWKFLSKPFGRIIGTTAGEIIAAKIAGRGGVDLPDGPDGRGKRSGGGAGGKLKGYGMKALGIAGGLLSAAAITEAITPDDLVEKNKDASVVDSIKNTMSDPQVIGGLIGTAIGAAAGSFIPGIGNIIGAELGALVGGTLFAKIGSWFKGTEENTKAVTKNSVETKKQTEALNAARAAQAGQSVFDATELSGLRQSIIGSAIAATTVSKAELAAEQNKLANKANMVSVTQPKTEVKTEVPKGSSEDFEAALPKMGYGRRQYFDDLVSMRQHADTQEHVKAIEDRMRRTIGDAIGKEASKVTLPSDLNNISAVDYENRVKREQAAIRAKQEQAQTAVNTSTVAPPPAQVKNVNSPTVNTTDQGAVASATAATRSAEAALPKDIASERTQAALLAEIVRSREAAEAQVAALTDLAKTLATRPSMTSSQTMFSRLNG